MPQEPAGKLILVLFRVGDLPGLLSRSGLAGARDRDVPLIDEEPVRVPGQSEVHQTVALRLVHQFVGRVDQRFRQLIE